MPHFSEKSVAEDYFIEKLKAKGWRFVPADELERESFEEPLLISNLVRALKKLNSDIEIGDEEINKVLNELKLKPTGQEGTKAILNLFKQGVSIKFEKDRLVKYVKLFDYENPEQNDFIASRQVVYNSGRGEIRTDIMLYVNGIPLVDIECKNPASFSESWFDAYKQIKEYEQKIPELYKYVQIGIAAEQIAKYFAIVPWEEDTRIYEWKEEQNDSIDSTIEMLAPNRLLDILKNYMFFRIEFGSSTKVITRYMQYRASEKIVKRVLDNFNGTEDKNKGLIWHWQGSGKTLTMIFAVNKLYRNELLENPTIFFVVDRQDLQIQLEKEFNALDIPKVEVIDSIEALRKTLKHDEGKGKRGIMITLIHKFRAEELDALQKELEAASKTNSTILNRKNVLAFVDEGHRTQYGTMAAQMRNILRKAFFFAFTGTPIAKSGKDTYEAFSYPPQEKYFDKYFITDSIKDGFTVKIVYKLRLEEDIKLKKEQLEAFLEIQDEELPEEVKEKVNESVKKKLTAAKMFLENPGRIKKIAEDIAKHFKENVDGKFKAMVVAVNRTACVHYKRALDEFLPNDWSEVVMTYDSRNDPKIIQDYFKGVLEKNNGKELDDIRKEIVERFNEEEKPKILIVTDMLLTGFDAPILQTMYLDKPLKEHKLLQAIARTNRPYKDLKEIGLILDYVGILKEVTKAFELYTKEEISGAIEKFDDLQDDFVKELDSTLALFKGIPKDKYDRETLLKTVEVLTSDDTIGKLFIKNYKSLRRLFELLGPNVIKAQRFSDYRWLTAIYVYYSRLVFRQEPHEELRYVDKYFEKTLKFVHKSTELTRLADNLPPVTIDENYLHALEEKAKSKEEKAANLVFMLNRFVLVERYKNPISETLAEKVEKLLKLWKKKTKDFEKIYKEEVKLIQEIQKLSERQKELKFSNMDYALLLTLENKFGQDEELVKDVKGLSKTLQEHLFPGWYLQTTARKNVEREIRTFMRKYIKSKGLEMAELEQIYQKMIENVKAYGKNA